MSLDIVNLIESNPITKLTGNYQSKLVEKVKNTFTEYEQQLFLSSFYCFLKYDARNDFVIDLDNVWKWLGFQQKVNAKMLLEKQFEINKDYKKPLLLLQQKQTSIKGGHNKETFMLNVDTFKKICLKAGTKKADEIHDYFIKLENIIFEITKEECDELKQQMQQLEEAKKTELQQLEITKNKETEEKLKEQKYLEREKILLNQFTTIGSIIYIIKVKTLEYGNYIIKIGESRRGILNRYNEHKTKYPECLLLDCFSVQNSKDFENFIHNHENIRLNKVNNLEGHETELELFLIGKNLSYKSLLDIINNNIKYFNNNTNKLELENKQLKMMIEMDKTNNDNPLIHELIKNVKQLTSRIDNLEQTNKLLIEKISSTQIKVSTGFNEPLSTVGPRLQKINPETLQLVKVYETVSEAMKENTNIKRSSINKAVVEDTIYCGFRWLLVDRDLDPNIIHTIKPTKKTKTQKLGYIAKLNSNKTEILNVYLDRKTAAQLNEYESHSALDNPVKNMTISRGHYYMLYDKCGEDLINEFENKYGQPILYKDGLGQYDLNHNLICEFKCKYDCIKALSMSDKTLRKSLETNKPYNGYLFKELHTKLKMI
jgi:hypothetical protein